jgi:hypothetical protein
MTYEYEEGQVPVPAGTCVRDGALLEAEAHTGGRTVGWFLTSALDASTWVFVSRGAPPPGPSERLRCPKCDRRYVHLTAPAPARTGAKA